MRMAVMSRVMLLLLLLLVVASGSHAEKLVLDLRPQPGDTLLTVQRFLSGNPEEWPTDSVTIFRLDYGGCLRGPLVFFDVQGKESFHLDAGKYYPSECNQSQ